MDPVLIIVFSSFVIFGGIFGSIIVRRIILMKTGDHVEAKIVSLEKNRRSNNDNGTRRYEYLINVVYSYKNQGYAENISLSQANMNAYLPHLTNVDGLYTDRGAVIIDNEMIPIVVDPKKPTRIIVNFDRLLAENYPEPFGTQTQTSNPTIPATDNTPLDSTEDTTPHNPYDTRNPDNS